MSIIGEPFADYVNNQIKVRQELMGEISNRGPEMLAWANVKTAWVKLASGVFLEGEEAEERLKTVGLDTNSHMGTKLAQKYILFSGTSTHISGSTLESQRFKFNEVYDPTDTDFGLVPMPGIESINVKDKNRGSIKEATVEIIANSRKQLEILDILYLRLGYTVLLEWGNSHYINNNKEYQEIGATQIDKFFGDGKKISDKSHRDFLSSTEALRKKYNGNYDGFVAKVVNFNWTFQPDGTYKITLKLISLGDVVESFKLNVISTSSYPEDGKSNRNIIEEELNKQIILNTLTSDGDRRGITHEYLVNGKPTSRQIGWFYGGSETLVFEDKKWAPADLGIIVGRVDRGRNYFLRNSLEDLIEDLDSLINKNRPLYQELLNENAIKFEIGTAHGGYFSDIEFESISEELSDYFNGVDGLKTSMENQMNRQSEYFTGDDYYFKLKIRPTTITINSQIAPKNSFYANNLDEEGKETESRLSLSNYYLKFTSLLSLINNILRDIPSAPSISQKPILGRRMPNQMSFDPRVCIVRNTIFYDKSNPNLYLHNYKQLEFFQKSYSASNGGEKIGDFGNCYLNFSTIVDSIDSNIDSQGDLSPFNFLKDICEKINKAMGGVNNLEPTINEKENTYEIIDSSSPSPKINNPQTVFQIFGYNGLPGNQSESTFVRNVDLKTEISPEFASMVTIGATASGYTKGMEATAFSKWNRGIHDRFNPSQPLPSPTPTTGSINTNQNNIEVDYFKYLLELEPLEYLGFSIVEPEPRWQTLNPEIIDTNITVATEFFKYLRAKTYEKDPENYASTSNGFIPFNLQLTMDGLSGMKIWNKIEVDTRFLPYNYPENLKFVIKRVSHKISNGDWETSLDTTVMPGSYSPNP